MSIKIGILGYGNLGRGVECAIKQNPDMELKAVFTRRDPATVKVLTEGVPVYAIEDAKKQKDEIDVMILCGGSATDLPVQTPEFVKMFNVVNSFDTHAKIPEHFAAVDEAAKASGKIGMISIGWDPGMFSLNRLYANAILPNGKDYTFWGKGVSQGHSDAIRRIEGVKDAILTTVRDAGPNACPPMVVGVGIGGNFEKCALMAKHALTRSLEVRSEIPYIRELEEEMLALINKTGIGPGGLGGTTTALAVNIETYPTHIAGLPVAVNICCHVNRHAVRVL